MGTVLVEKWLQSNAAQSKSKRGGSKQNKARQSKAKAKSEQTPKWRAKQCKTDGNAKPTDVKQSTAKKTKQNKVMYSKAYQSKWTSCYSRQPGRTKQSKAAQQGKAKANPTTQALAS